MKQKRWLDDIEIDGLYQSGMNSKAEKRGMQRSIVWRYTKPRPLKGEYILRMFKILAFSTQG